MKAHLVTTLSLLLCGAALGLPFGCAADVGAPATGDDTATESAAMNPAYTNHYYRVWKQCSALEPCSYHFVREVNAMNAYVWVSGLTFDGPGFDARTQRAILEAPWEDLILYGTFAAPGRTEDPGPFVIRRAFRGMPGIPVDWDDQFYVVRSIAPPILDVSLETEIVPPPPTQLRTGAVVSEPGQIILPTPQILSLRVGHVADRIGGTDSFGIDTVSLARAAAVGGDPAWITDRVLHEGAVVSGHVYETVTASGVTERVLDAGQVFVQLPDRAGACLTVQNLCNPGLRPTYARTVDGCLAFQGCVEQGCRAHAPVTCAAGYQLSHWPVEGPGCFAYACDPAFLTE